MRIHMKVFINKHGQNAGRVEHQQTDMARARHKSSPVSRRGRSAANVIQGAKQREIIQVHDNSPDWANRVQTTRRERDPRQAINFRAGRDQTRNEMHRLGARHK